VFIYVLNTSTLLVPVENTKNPQSDHLHTQMKIMCALTKASMGDFIRIAIADKIRELKNQKME